MYCIHCGLREPVPHVVAAPLSFSAILGVDTYWPTLEPPEVVVVGSQRGRFGKLAVLPRAEGNLLLGILKINSV